MLLGDVLSSAYQQAQLEMGIFSPETISVGDLFVGAVIPGLLLVCMYIIYMAFIAFIKPDAMPAIPREAHANANHILEDVLLSLLPPELLRKK